MNMNREESRLFVSCGFFTENLCLANLFNFSEEAIKNVDKEYPFDMFYLYFQKSFSNIPDPKTLK